MPSTLDNILNILVPVIIIGVMLALFWKPFRIGVLFAWLGRKISEWRDNQETKERNPVNRLDGGKKEVKWVFE